MGIDMADNHFDCDVVGYTYNTRGRTITQSDIVFHAGHSGDFFSIHLDDEYAKNTVYKQRVAHGTLTLTAAIGLKYDTDPRNGLKISYGYDKVRFPKPVFVGDTIHLQVEVTHSEMDPSRAGIRRIVESTKVLNQRNEIVLSLDHILIRWLS